MDDATKRLRDALEKAIQIPRLLEDARMNQARANNREGTVESIMLSRKSAQALRDQVQQIIRDARKVLNQTTAHEGRRK